MEKVIRMMRESETPAAAHASDLTAQAIDAVRELLRLPPDVDAEVIAKRYSPLLAGWIAAASQFEAAAKPAGKQPRRSLPPAALKEIGFEALVVVAAASAMLAGEPLAAVDRDRLALASERIQDALRKAGL